MSEAPVANGKIEGVFKRWDEHGWLIEQIEMKNGEPDGLALAWYPDGSLKAEARLQHGKLLEQKSWKEGEHTGALLAATQTEGPSPLPAARY